MESNRLSAGDCNKTLNERSEFCKMKLNKSSKNCSHPATF